MTTAPSRVRMSRADAGAPIEFTAAIIGGRGAPFELRRIRTEPLRPYEIRVRVAATGICQTDAHSRGQDLLVPLPTHATERNIVKIDADMLPELAGPLTSLLNRWTPAARNRAG